MTVLNINSSAGNDDAYQRQDTASFNSTATTLFCISAASAGSRWSCAMRFPTTIPNAATINSATITVVPTSNDDVNCTIYLEDVDDSVNFTTNPSVVSRTKTATGTAWSVNNLGSSAVDSADFAATLQLVVDRAGFSDSSHVMVFFWGEGNPARTLEFASRDNATSANWPILNVDYTAGGTVVQASFSNQVEHLIITKNGLTINLESILPYINNNTLQIEYLLSLTSEELLQLEHLLTTLNSFELNIGQRTDLNESKTINIETLLNLFLIDSLALENLLVTNKDNSVTIEHLLGIINQNTIDVKTISKLLNNSEVNTENLLVAFNNNSLQLENLITTILQQTSEIEENLQILLGSEIIISYIAQLLNNNSLETENLLTVNLQRELDLEHLRSIINGGTVNFENLLTFASENIINEDFTLSAENINIAQIEHLLALYNTSVFSVELLQGILNGSSVPIEYSGAKLVIFDGSIPLEHLLQIISNNTVNQEATLGIENINSSQIEFLSSLYNSVIINIEHLQEILSRNDVKIEYTQSGGIILVDSIVLIEHLLSLKNNLNLTIENLQTSIKENSIIIEQILGVLAEENIEEEHSAFLLPQNTIQIEYPITVEKNSSTNIEKLLQVLLTNILNISNNKQLNEFSQANVEWISRLGIDFETAVEFLESIGEVSKQLQIEELLRLSNASIVPISYLGTNFGVDAILTWILKERKNIWIEKRNTIWTENRNTKWVLTDKYRGF